VKLQDYPNFADAGASLRLQMPGTHDTATFQPDLILVVIKNMTFQQSTDD
jgi:hypothetical protein